MAFMASFLFCTTLEASSPAAKSPLSERARSTPAGMTRLALEVFINDHTTNLIADIYSKPDGRLFATRQELQAIGLKPPGRGGDQEMIAFDAIPGLSMRYDEAAQKLHLGAPDEIRLAREYDLSATGALPQYKPVEESREFGAVVNYNAYGTLARGYSSGGVTYSTGTLSLDSRIFSPFGLLQHSTVIGNSLVKQGALRLDTAYVFAHRDTATTTTIGDAVSGGLSWSRPVRFGGMQVSRSFGLRPDLVTAPLPSVSGSAAVPSTVDVYIDNMRIASQDVSAGPYRISNLPVSGDSGTARIVVRDVTGKETATALPFFTSSKLLAPGVLDFSAEIGYPRLNYAIESFNYSKKLMGQGSFRYGLLDHVTLEGHAEGTQKLALAGGGVVYNAGKLGTFSVAGAGSWYSGSIGSMASAGWQSNWKRLFFGLNTQRTFGSYIDIATVTATLTNASKLSSNFLDSGFFVLNRTAAVPRALDRISVGTILEDLNATVSASFINVERTNRDVSRLATVTWSQTFAKRYNVFATAFSDFGGQRRSGILGGLTFNFDDDIVITSSVGASRFDRAGGIEATRTVGSKPYDYGWRIFDNEGRTSSRGVQAAIKTPYARSSATIRQDGSTVGGAGELDGAAVISPSGIFASNRIHDGFAIVDIGAPGVEVLHENRPIARSDIFGKVLVPNVPSGQRTRIAVSPETLPGDSHAMVTEAEVLPTWRGSATVRMKTVAAKNTANVEIRQADDTHFPPGTRVAHAESGKTFALGYNGKTFLPEIDEQNTLTIEIDTRSCTVRFNKSDRRGNTGQVGPLTCALK